ncbi:hypothetical protein [uncultured Ferrimonas sp.]|uniref:hypothetical protein n=1 Tax=uncultured Ferrimonas sp. TaxID=432640 RepID=UPI002610BDDF|nr:hypothetical protein [uncultured Ferrimonas sp.]
MKTILSVVMATAVSIAAGVEAKSGLDPFFANQSLQQQAPQAFVLQPQAEGFLRSAWPQTQQQGLALAAAIIEDDELAEAVSVWPELTFAKQQPLLQRIFELQCQQMGIEAPTLLIDDSSYPDKMVYFDFDPATPDRGTVFLNSAKLAEQPPVVSLALLLHETRHSYQFQLAFAQDNVLAQGYRAAFKAQKQLAPKSFSDFLTLGNEYEAFQFANLVMGELFNWKVDMPSMGTYASQYWANKQLKIDLLEQLDQHQPTPLLDLFNQQMQAQKEKLGR